MEPEAARADARHARWAVIRDVLAFQCKLLVEGLRDVVLFPVSLVVGLVSIIGKNGRPGDEFYELLRMARRSERWINLFGAVEERGPDVAGTDRPSAPVPDIDTLVARVETFLVEECRKGGMTAQAKERLDAALDSLHDVRNRIGRSRVG